MEEINGREYFDRLRSEMVAENFGIDKDPADITPEDIRALPPVPGLKLLSAERRWPKRLTAEETARRALRSEAFLKMPVVHFPAEETQEEA